MVSRRGPRRVALDDCIDRRLRDSDAGRRSSGQTVLYNVWLTKVFLHFLNLNTTVAVEMDVVTCLLLALEFEISYRPGPKVEFLWPMCGFEIK